MYTNHQTNFKNTGLKVINTVCPSTSLHGSHLTHAPDSLSFLALTLSHHHHHLLPSHHLAARQRRLCLPPFVS
ncbi:hypothetical protein E2C01_085339 [Portunus trituberculatus]|uniref:Uncharacterized protein n=1 Tax=Portunus trituberculatus TaxID=210409 RepID=A0A5B7JBN3_PORTR|nr:hypothetical protein [Portunus trituberculatus]